MPPVAMAAGTAPPPSRSILPRSTLSWVLFGFHVLPLLIISAEVELPGRLMALR